MIRRDQSSEFCLKVVKLLRVKNLADNMQTEETLLEFERRHIFHQFLNLHRIFLEL